MVEKESKGDICRVNVSEASDDESISNVNDYSFPLRSIRST
nr:9857_t:CDS:2 [Entrophospora candida]